MTLEQRVAPRRPGKLLRLSFGELRRFDFAAGTTTTQPKGTRRGNHEDSAGGPLRAVQGAEWAGARAA